jgi:hypothetical protein
MKIVATILLVIAMLGSALLFIRCSKEAKSMGDIEGTPMSGMVSSMLGGDIPSAGAWSTGSYMAIGAVLGCLFGIVAAFMRSKNVGFAGAAAAGLFSILLIVFVPSLDPGMFGGANPKTIAIIVGLIGLAGAGIVGFVASKRTA